MYLSIIIFRYEKRLKLLSSVPKYIMRRAFEMYYMLIHWVCHNILDPLFEIYIVWILSLHKVSFIIYYLSYEQ